jgi:hypothetical protein
MKLKVKFGTGISRVVKIPGKPLKKHPDRLPWPRLSSPDEQGRIVALGVDVVAKRQDIIKIVHKFFKVNNIPMEELLQEVYVAIIHKNFTRSAHDSRKSSFGHYVYMVANNVCINLVHRKRRYDKESESIHTPSGHDDNRTILDSFEAPPEKNCDGMSEYMDEIETNMRRHGMWDMARYLRAVRSGADADVIREALSWGGRKISSKTIRDIRSQIQTVVRDGHANLL